MRNSYILFTFIVAYVITFLTTPLVKRLAFRIGAVDVPKDDRRMHKKPTALLGGLAIFLGFLISTLAFVPLHDDGGLLNRKLIGVLAGCTLIVIVGIFDDRYALSAKLKLALQIVAALIPVSQGVIIDIIAVPKFIDEFGYLDLGYFAAPLTVLWIVGITNAVNLLDGLDGLAVGVASISSVTLLCIALMVGEPEIVLITAALAGACFGFLPYNFNPAKLFMGDTGALFLGFILSTLAVMGLFKGYAVISLAAPILILGLPIFDTSAAILRRMHHHQPIMSPDRSHLHHRLVDAGLSQKQAVVVIYVLCALLCIIAVALVSTKAVSVLVVILILALFIVLVAANKQIVKWFGGDKGIPDEPTKKTNDHNDQ